MLLCGIINEMRIPIAYTDLLSYTFCQAVDPRINSTTAILRELVYLVINQESLFISHIRKKYNHADKALFEDANFWAALSEIFITLYKIQIQKVLT